MLTLRFQCRLKDGRPCQDMQANRQMLSASHRALQFVSKYNAIQVKRHLSGYSVMLRPLVLCVQADSVAFKPLSLLYAQVSQPETVRSSSTANNQSTVSNRSSRAATATICQPDKWLQWLTRKLCSVCVSNKPTHLGCSFCHRYY